MPLTLAFAVDPCTKIENSCVPAAAIYSQAGIPQISPSTTNPEFTRQGYKTTFRVVSDDTRIGTALAEGRTVQVIGAEHYVAAWQRWVCTAAPIRHPISGETLAVIDVTGYRERVQAHTVLAVQATVRTMGRPSVTFTP